MNPAAGSNLGPYEIVSAIGAGGMGEVYRARDPRVGRDVAIKISAEQFNERFDREVRAVAALNHPNICSLYDVGPNYLVMELVEGQTLAERIEQGAIPLEESLTLARQIADALEAAHEKVIVHRDLKPGNIKIKPDGTVKVLDFGLAKVGGTPAISSDDSPTLSVAQTAAGVILGTAAYMSPEQARGKPVDKRADIWAFGVVLYEMLTGMRLFSGDTISDTLAAVLRAEPEWDRVPAKARRLLRTCLQKNLKQRLADISDAKLLLDDTPEFAQAPAKQSWLARGLAAVFLLAFVIVSFVHFREKPLVLDPMRFQVPLPEKVNFSTTGAFALSPDGRRLAFYAVGTDGVTRLWIRPIDSLEARPLPGTENPSSSPFIWSPDSRFIAFGTTGGLNKIDISSGSAQPICNVRGTVVGGYWSTENEIIFGSQSGGLLRVSAVGGEPTLLTKPDQSRKETYHAMPVLLSDGRHFLYKRNSDRIENAGIYAGSMDAKPEEQGTRLLLATETGVVYVPSANSGQGQLLYLRGGTLMTQAFDEKRLQLAGEPVRIAERVGSFRDGGYFSASTNGILIYRTGGSETNIFRLTWFDRQGKVLSRAGEPGNYLGMALSPDGMSAAIRQADSRGSNLWLFDLRAKSLPASRLEDFL